MGPSASAPAPAGRPVPRGRSCQPVIVSTAQDSLSRAVNSGEGQEMGSWPISKAVVEVGQAATALEPPPLDLQALTEGAGWGFQSRLPQAWLFPGVQKLPSGETDLCSSSHFLLFTPVFLSSFNISLPITNCSLQNTHCRNFGKYKEVKEEVRNNS